MVMNVGVRPGPSVCRTVALCVSINPERSWGEVWWGGSTAFAVGRHCDGSAVESISVCWLSSSVCCQTGSSLKLSCCFHIACSHSYVQCLSSSSSCALLHLLQGKLFWLKLPISNLKKCFESLYSFPSQCAVSPSVPQVWTTACSSTSRPSSCSKWTGRSCWGCPTRSCCLWAWRGSVTRSWCWRPWICSAPWSVTRHKPHVRVNIFRQCASVLLFGMVMICVFYATVPIMLWEMKVMSSIFFLSI